MKQVKRNGFVSSLFIIMFFFLTVCPLAASNEGPQLSPVNPHYLNYIEQARPSGHSAVNADGYALGHVPGPQQQPSFKGYKSTVSVEALPSSYDLRTKDKLTAIRDQGACGSCWAFGAYSSLESYLKPTETTDFSEQHLIDWHGFDNGPCVGGQIYMSVAYLTRWDGPVYESDDPYHYLSPKSVAPKKHVQNVVFLPGRTSATDNAAIKQALMDYGAIDASYYASCDSCYNSTYKSYYYSGTERSDHEVAIVGWDDNFDKNKFETPAPGNGAFIFRNSWGTIWGESGYGYVSYYDSVFASDDICAAVMSEKTTNYSGVYQYDPLGQVSSYYSATKGTAWGANIYTASSNSPIAAVGFYALSTNTAYQLYVYTGVSSDNPVSGTLQASKSGTIALPGFYTIALPSLVSGSAGQKFSVVIKLTTPGNDYPVAIERYESGYSSKATSSPGQSFMSDDGTKWADLITVWPSDSANVCLKAYTVGTEPVDYSVLFSNSIGSRNTIKISDMSGSLPVSGGVIGVSAWDVNGNALPESGGATPLNLYNHETKNLSGSDLAARFPSGTPMLYKFSISSSKLVITNVKNSTNDTFKVPIVYLNGVTDFVSNSIGNYNNIKVSDMSGALPVGGGAISVLAWDTNGNALAESGSTVPLILSNHGTTSISGSNLAARFPTGSPMIYKFGVPSAKVLITNVKSSTDGKLNVPLAYTSGVSNFVSNSIGNYNTLEISDLSGILPMDGGAITVSAWDANGNALSESGSAAPLKLFNHGTTSISGPNLSARFPTGSPITYEFSIESSKVLITNVKSSTDGLVEIPSIFPRGISNFATNYVSPLNTIKISDTSGVLPVSGASISIAAWDTNGNAVLESGAAIPLKLYNLGTTSILGSDLLARFPSGSPVLYEFSIGSSNAIITSLTTSIDETIKTPTVFTIGAYGGI